MHPKKSELARLDSLRPVTQGPSAAMDDDTAATALDADAYPMPPAGRRPRLLVAEDDPVIRQLLATMLKRLEYDLELAEDGEQALEKWSEAQYDLILMDIQMPFLDGFATTREIRLREADNGKRTVIVAMTAHASREDQARCAEAGMDAYISKPIDFKKSLALINSLLQQQDEVLESAVI